jgi:lysophospholipase L1-like esterase
MDLDSKVIVFMGDSITEFWQRESDFFSKNSNFINKGVSGQTTTQMLHRFQKDVIDLNPSTVIVLAGINDIAENSGPILIDAIRDNIIDMVDLALNSNIKIIDNLSFKFF